MITAASIISVGALAFLVNVLTSLVKNFIQPKFGSIGVQVFAFILALIGAFYILYGANIPNLQSWVVAAGAIFSVAVAYYEVILNKISVFSVGAFPSVNPGANRS
jgi:hypothetical protein